MPKRLKLRITCFATFGVRCDVWSREAVTAVETDEKDDDDEEGADIGEAGRTEESGSGAGGKDAILLYLSLVAGKLSERPASGSIDKFRLISHVTIFLQVWCEWVLHTIYY